MTLEERLKKSQQWHEEKERERLEKERRQSKVRQKQTNSCYFSAGRLLCKYFPALTDLDEFDVNTQSVPALRELEPIFRYLSESPQLLQRLKESANHSDLLE